MILLSQRTKVYFYTEPVNMRYSFDTLMAKVKYELGRSVFSDSIFLFIGKRKDKVKALYWDSNGLVLFYKRLEKGRFSIFKEMNKKEIQMSMSELQLFFEGAKIEKKLPLSPEPMDTSRYA